MERIKWTSSKNTAEEAETTGREIMLYPINNSWKMLQHTAAHFGFLFLFIFGKIFNYEIILYLQKILHTNADSSQISFTQLS